jgi:hypothetical protein
MQPATTYHVSCPCGWGYSGWTLNPTLAYTLVWIIAIGKVDLDPKTKLLTSGCVFVPVSAITKISAKIRHFLETTVIFFRIS